MTNFDADFDYLDLLGIDPAEALRAPAALVEPIKAKKKEWTAQALNPLYQQSARSNLERARQFEALLGEPAALAAYVGLIRQVRAARRGEHEAALAALIALAVGGGRAITTWQKELIAKEAKAEGIPDALLDEVLADRSIAVAAAARAEKPKLPMRTPALDATVLSEVQNWLKVLGKRSLYELLDLPNASPPERLVAQAKLLFHHWSKVLPKTTTSTAWEKSLQACLTYLKDRDAKARYDGSLFNRRIHRLVSRIDLILSGADFGPEEQARLTRLGVQDLGLSEAVVQQCIAARMAEKGLAVGGTAAITVKVKGQVRCARCGAWNDSKPLRCRECGSSLQRKCANPSCTAGLLPVDAKACPGCSLPVVRGVQYRTLLALADAFLESGSHQAAVSVCQRAAQILAGPAVEQRLKRSALIRTLIASAKVHAAAKAWEAVVADLKELLPLAPRVALQGVPSLEKIAGFLADLRQKVRAIPADAGAIKAAKVCLVCLRHWSDFAEAHQRIRAACSRLEAEGELGLASQLAARLLELRPGDEGLAAYIRRLEPEVKRREEQAAERRQAMVEYIRAVRESRLYAAEQSLNAIELSPATGPEPPGAERVRRTLADVRRELAEIRQLVGGTAHRDRAIERYQDLLLLCRDCREALMALQSLPLDPPDPPAEPTLVLEGNRRVLAWKPPATGRRVSYVVQRSITRPGSRQVDPPFQTVYEGELPHYSDDEVAHGGVILRYMVHAVARGKIEVDGVVVRSFETASRPVSFPGVLIWREVMNLKGSRQGRALHITWCTPPGARQVLIERWPGGPDDHGLGVVVLPPTAENRLVDVGLGEGMVHTYRLTCVYDGPDGEFRTSGVCLTDGFVAAAPGSREGVIGPAAAGPSSNGT
jgi:hypothetical protein